MYLFSAVIKWRTCNEMKLIWSNWTNFTTLAGLWSWLLHDTIRPFISILACKNYCHLEKFSVILVDICFKKKIFRLISWLSQIKVNIWPIFDIKRFSIKSDFHKQPDIIDPMLYWSYSCCSNFPFYPRLFALILVLCYK